MLRAVLDANVYVSAAIRPEGPPGRIIERFLREATFQIVMSLAIAEEVLRALAYPKVRQAIRGHIGPELWFEDLALLADLVSDTRRALGICADPDDDKYIGAALEGRAAFVVTGDRQLLALREHEGIRIVDTTCVPRDSRLLKDSLVSGADEARQVWQKIQSRIICQRRLSSNRWLFAPGR